MLAGVGERGAVRIGECLPGKGSDTKGGGREGREKG